MRHLACLLTLLLTLPALRAATLTASEQFWTTTLRLNVAGSTVDYVYVPSAGIHNVYGVTYGKKKKPFGPAWVRVEDGIHIVQKGYTVTTEENQTLISSTIWSVDGESGSYCDASQLKSHFTALGGSIVGNINDCE